MTDTLNTLTAEQEALLKAKGRAQTPVPRAPSNGDLSDLSPGERAILATLKKHQEDTSRRLSELEVTSVKDALKAVRGMEGEEGAKERVETAQELRAAANGDQFRVVKIAREVQENRYVALGIETAKLGALGYAAWVGARVAWAWVFGEAEDIVDALD